MRIIRKESVNNILAFENLFVFKRGQLCYYMIQ